jgi:hypothetical protein
MPASQQSVGSTDTATDSSQFQTLAWIAFSWLLAKGLLVILVEPALGRYVTAVAALLPCVVGWIAYHLVCLVLGPLPQHLSNSQSVKDGSRHC